jgi:C7-cyclitol 7-kinase
MLIMGNIVVDVGGTNLRLGYFENGALADVQRVPVQNFYKNSGLAPDALYQQFLNQLLSEIKVLLERHPRASVGIAFPGPVNPKGKVACAPTLWGEQLRDIDLRADLELLLNRKTYVLNDISAAVWRYVRTQQEDFCLITISSGIGNKVYRNGEILINEHGFGGEIGHSRVAEGIEALRCDCGGEGHLGGVASGRGTLALARLYAAQYPNLLAKSPLAGQAPEHWSTTDIVSALHANDDFAWRVCIAGQRYLVTAMRHLYHWIGIRKYIFIGGFVGAIGEPYITRINEILRQEHWFGMSVSELETICALGALDDDHSLIGMGRYLEMQGMT